MMNLRTTLIAAIALFSVACHQTRPAPEPVNLFVGTFTREGGTGIHTMQFDTLTGTITNVQLAVGGLKDPSFIALSPDKSVLYGYNNVTTDSAEVIAWRVDPQTRALTPFSRVKTPTKTFCYVALFEDGKYLGVASYNEGTSYLFPLDSSGAIVNAPSVVQHTGSSVHPRQTQTHAHLILPDPQTGNVYIPDLGLDQIIIYSQTEGKLDSIGRIQTAPGAGPRHIAFHNSGKYLAGLNEINNTVTIYSRDANGLFTVAGQTLSTIPADFAGETTAADIHFSKDGRALYASNRGHNSVAIYAFDPEQGTITPRGWITEDIVYPRNFAIDPSGKFLLVANQQGASIVVYAIGDDPTQLTYTGHRAEVAEPVCLVF